VVVDLVPNVAELFEPLVDGPHNVDVRVAAAPSAKRREWLNRQRFLARPVKHRRTTQAAVPIANCGAEELLEVYFL
jgi:hypothetical protein